MTDANLKGVAEWTLSHKATELFNVSDLSEMDKMCSINVEGEYIKKRHCDNVDEKTLHDKKEIRKAELMKKLCMIKKKLEKLNVLLLLIVIMIIIFVLNNLCFLVPTFMNC